MPRCLTFLAFAVECIVWSASLFDRSQFPGLERQGHLLVCTPSPEGRRTSGKMGPYVAWVHYAKNVLYIAIEEEIFKNAI